VRIFYASDTSPDSTFQSNLWRANLYGALVSLGHDVVEFDYDLNETFQKLDPADPFQKRFIDENRPRVTAELLRQVKRAQTLEKIDLFFSYFFDACVFPEAIDEIRGMGIMTANWFCNGSYQLHLVSEIAPRYDWCLVPEKFRLKDYVALGARPIYSQEASNPEVYKRYDLPVEYDVTFVGQAYGDRPDIIQFLVDKNIDVRIWGRNWQQAMRGSRPAIYGGILSDDEMIKMYSRSKISLGFSACGETHRSPERILQIRLRDFEAPMSGAFYMTEYMEELEEFYDIGKEIVCYYDKEDLAAKINYYLRNDTEREAIRRAGQQRCLRDHTWQKRFELAFEKMGLI
jgi:hypothetical protein